MARVGLFGMKFHFTEEDRLDIQMLPFDILSL